MSKYKYKSTAILKGAKVMPQLSIADEEIQRQREILHREKFLATKDLLALISGDILKSSRLEVLECALMSGSSLGKELNTPEEDEAWAHFNPET
jgi:hypothetical protein